MARPFFALVLLVCVACGKSAPPEVPPPDLEAPPKSVEAVPACPDKERLPAGDRVWFLHHEGVLRSVRVHVPERYDPDAAWPVVLNLHGYTSNAGAQEGYSGMSPVADEAGFIALYPEGVKASELGVLYTEDFRSWNAGPCCGVAKDRDVDDLGFIEGVIELVSEKLCVDPKRIFATGLSNGAFFSHRLACELSHRIAAIGPVAGVNGMASCAPSRPVPVMHFHGTEDVLVPYGGSANFPSVEASTSGWVARNGCDPTPTETFNEGDTVCQAWSGCEANASVVLCTTDGGGHTWPGGTVPGAAGKTTEALNATRAMWDFFKAHPLP